MFKTVHVREGYNAPYIFCDVCQERIENAEDAISFNMGDTCQVKSSAPVIHIHKGKCDDAAREKIGDEAYGWDELSRHLLQIIYNSGLSIEKLAAIKEADKDAHGVFNYPKEV
jgi:hypothetical protein